MRLLNTSTLKLEEFVATSPNYAILSHTWEEGEVLFEDFKQGTQQQKRGYEKVKNFCKYAGDYQYVWVDTCCIDKSSSAELSEAINSMFSWYRQAHMCFVYLNIKTGSDLSADELRSSRWISRGWCLQELIAPSQVKFFNCDWEIVGSRQRLAEKLHQVTNIDLDLLRRDCVSVLDLEQFSIARRMSWAVNRETTRPEDIAYCLLGLFDVHIPLLYGEGGQRAFLRLQEEILKRSQDYSILAWDNTSDPGYRSSLAKHPKDFRHGAPIVTMVTNAQPFEMTNKGLRVTLPLCDTRDDSGNVIAILHNCRYEDDFRGPLGIVLKLLDAHDVYSRTHCPIRVVNYRSETSKPQMRTIYVRSHLLSQNSSKTPRPFPIWFIPAFFLRPLPRGTVTVQPPPNGSWNPDTYVLRMSTKSEASSHVLLCYKDGETHLPFVKVIVSPTVVVSRTNTHVGLCDPFASGSLYQNLSDSMVVQVNGIPFRAWVTAKEKLILDERVMEVTLALG